MVETLKEWVRQGSFHLGSKALNSTWCHSLLSEWSWLPTVMYLRRPALISQPPDVDHSYHGRWAMLGWVYTSLHFSSNFSSKGESTPVVYMLSPVETMKSHRCQKQKSPMAAATSSWWWCPEPQSPIATKWISSCLVSSTWPVSMLKIKNNVIAITQPDYLYTRQYCAHAERKSWQGKVKWSKVEISFCRKHWCKEIWSRNIYSNSYHVIQFSDHPIQGKWCKYLSLCFHVVGTKIQEELIYCMGSPPLNIAQVI